MNTINASKMRFAPGEDQCPLGVLMDSEAEEMSFPKIYGGQRFKYKSRGNKTLTYSKRVKSEIRRYDRRVGSNVSKLFYSFKKDQLIKISNSITFHMKKSKNGNSNGKLTSRIVFIIRIFTLIIV